MSETNLITDHNQLNPVVTWESPTVPMLQQDCPNGSEIEKKNCRENVFFDATGKFAAGHPGLPGAGRPRTRIISEALKQALADGKADELKDTLIGLTQTAKDSVKLAAIQEIADRTEGKAVQNVRHAGVFMVLAPGEDVLNAAFGSLPPDESE